MEKTPPGEPNFPQRHKLGHAAPQENCHSLSGCGCGGGTPWGQGRIWSSPAGWLLVGWLVPLTGSVAFLSLLPNEHKVRRCRWKRALRLLQHGPAEEAPSTAAAYIPPTKRRPAHSRFFTSGRSHGVMYFSKFSVRSLPVGIQLKVWHNYAVVWCEMFKQGVNYMEDVATKCGKVFTTNVLKIVDSRLGENSCRIANSGMQNYNLCKLQSEKRCQEVNKIKT